MVMSSRPVPAAALLLAARSRYARGVPAVGKMQFLLQRGQPTEDVLKWHLFGGEGQGGRRPLPP